MTRDSVRHLLSGSALALIGKLFTVGLALVIAALITRYLAIDEAGKYFYSFSVIILGTVLGRFGLEKAAIKYIAHDRSLNNFSSAWSTYKKCLKLVLLQAGIAAIVVWVFLFFSKFKFTTLELILLSSTVIFLSYQYFFSEGLRGFSDIINAVFFGGFFFNLGVVLLILLAISINVFESFTSVALIIFISAAINTLLGMFIVKKVYGETIAASDPQNSKRLLNLSVPVGIKSLFAMILTSGDLWILGYFASAKDVAIYGAVSRLLVIIGFMLQSVNVVISPMIAAHVAKNELKKSEGILRLASTLGFIAGACVVSFLLVFGEFILHWFFGGEYSGGYQILLILLIGKLFVVATGSCGPVLLMTGNERYSMYSVIIVSMITITLSYPVIVNFGVTGIAWLFALALATQQLSLYFKARISAGINTAPSINSIKKLVRGEFE